MVVEIIILFSVCEIIEACVECGLIVPLKSVLLPLCTRWHYKTVGFRGLHGINNKYDLLF